MALIKMRDYILLKVKGINDYLLIHQHASVLLME